MPQLAVTTADLTRGIADRSARVGIISQGYVGLPLAVEFARVGFAVTGFDTSIDRVTTLNAGRSHTPDVPDGATQALDALFPGAVVRRNVIVGGSSAQYPRDNFFVRSWAQVKFEDLSQGRLRLTDGSPFRRAGLDGADVGVDDHALRDSIRPGGDGRR